MKKKLRAWHRWASIIISIPLALIVVTGIILLNRNNFEWIQPKTEVSSQVPGAQLVSYEKILQDFKRDNDSIDQIIYRPEKFNISIRYKSGLETQIHPHTGSIVKSAMRRTNILIELHQGTFFGKNIASFLFIPVGFTLLFLLISGIIIFPFKSFKK